MDKQNAFRRTHMDKLLYSFGVSVRAKRQIFNLKIHMNDIGFIQFNLSVLKLNKICQANVHHTVLAPLKILAPTVPGPQ